MFTNVTFDVGETSKTITLTTNVDSTPDNEALTIFLVDPPIARLGNPSEMDVTILDFTDRELSIADELVLEGNPAQFVVSLNEPSLEQVTVQYTTNSGSGSFVPTSGMLTFEIGDLSKTIEVTTLDNAPDRNDETFFVDLSAPTNGVIVDSQGAGTILKKGATPDLPGDRIGTALPINVVSNQVNTFEETIGDGIYRNHDVDLFAVNLQAGQRLVSVLQSDTGLQASVRVFDALGQPLSASEAGSLELIISSTATYYVGVSTNDDYDPLVENSGSSGDQLGDYRLGLIVFENVNFPVVSVYRDAAGNDPINQQGSGIDFGEVTVGDRTRFDFYLNNDGNAPLSVDSVEVPSGVSIVGNPTGLLPAGALRRVVLEVDTSVAQSIDGSIRVQTDDPSNPDSVSYTHLTLPTKA